MIKVALVDDHNLLRNSLASLVNSFSGPKKADKYIVSFEADNGLDMIRQLVSGKEADIILLDITMPEMNGFEALKWLKKNHPSIKVIMLTMIDNENSILECFRSGACAYLVKDSKPADLKLALDEVTLNGHFYTSRVANVVIKSLQPFDEEHLPVERLSKRELAFLQLLCSELPYKEIAMKMQVSPRTIDNYRDELFNKLNVKSRVGLVIYAIKNGLFNQ